MHQSTLRVPIQRKTDIGIKDHLADLFKKKFEGPKNHTMDRVFGFYDLYKIALINFIEINRI